MKKCITGLTNVNEKIDFFYQVLTWNIGLEYDLILKLLCYQ